jgi:hypothetical protein
MLADNLTGQGFAGAIAFFETKRDSLISGNTFFSNLSLYCLKLDVDKVEARRRYVVRRANLY